MTHPLPGTGDDPVALLAQLVAIASENPGLAEGGAGEAGIAAFCAAWLAARGFEVHRLESPSGRPSLVGVARGSGRRAVADAQRAPGHRALAGYDAIRWSRRSVTGSSTAAARST